MINERIKTTIMAGFCYLVLCCLIIPQDGFSEEKKVSLNKEGRARINYIMTLETEKDIASFLSRPVELISEKILKNIEEKQDIEIKRSSMIKADVCLHELLSSIGHMAKISSGYKVQRVVIKLEGTTTRASIWSQWRVRKLEPPTLTATLYYNDPEIAPSEISCMGHKYH